MCLLAMTSEICTLTTEYVLFLKFFDYYLFLSLRVFGLLSSSSLLFPQYFGWYVLQPSSGVCRVSRVWQTHEEGRRTYQLKRCGNNNKDEDNSPKTLNDKNQQALFQKFRQLLFICEYMYLWEGVLKSPQSNQERMI